MRIEKLSAYLRKNDGFILLIFTLCMTFGTYACMYAFRKPIAAANFDGMSVWGIDYKILVITTQVIGYTVSKFVGIKYVSEYVNGPRATIIFGLILTAQVSLLLFAITPEPYNIGWIFFNGLPLGMVWGFVFAYVEGRRTTEILAVGLTAAQIFSSGWLKAAGASLMANYGVSELWMPFVTGCVFFPPMMVCVFLLSHMPPPTAADVAMKTERVAMGPAERKSFFTSNAFGLIALLIAYVGILALRDSRDNFMSNMLVDIGESLPKNFSIIENWVGFATLAVFFVIYFFKDNFKAFVGITGFIILGFGILGVSTYMFDQKMISGITWLIFIGIGTYVSYAPMNTILFDRMIGMLKIKSNCGFLIYVADALGYLASVVVMFVKNFGSPQLNWTSFLMNFCYTMALVGIICSVAYLLYFWNKNKAISHDPNATTA